MRWLRGESRQGYLLSTCCGVIEPSRRVMASTIDALQAEVRWLADGSMVSTDCLPSELISGASEARIGSKHAFSGAQNVSKCSHIT